MKVTISKPNLINFNAAKEKLTITAKNKTLSLTYDQLRAIDINKASLFSPGKFIITTSTNKSFSYSFPFKQRNELYELKKYLENKIEQIQDLSCQISFDNYKQQR